MVCRLYGLPRRPSFRQWLEEYWPVCTNRRYSTCLLIVKSLIATNQAFREIVISLAATYGLYLFSSLLHFEPWHMLTSFIQYMFLLPSCKSFFNSCLSEIPDSAVKRC